MESGERFYQTGGTMAADAPSYIERQADRELYQGLIIGEFCYVLTSRQMGKSSLMVRTARRLRQAGAAVVVIDLTAFGCNLSVEQWYDGLIRRIGLQLDLEEELEAFTEAHAHRSPLQQWLTALEEVVLPRCPSPIVLFVDEIDTVRSLPFSTDEFFAAIRECYNRRTEDPIFERLTFCLLGVATPSDLIQDVRTTPFNIGRRIELTDFAEVEAAPLAQRLGSDPWNNQRLLQRVLYWTGGHPYLTQRLCQAVAGLTAATADPQSTNPGPPSVDPLCDQLFLSHRARERDDNLLFVRDRLLRSEADVSRLLSLYAQVRSPRQRVPDDEANPLVSLLRLSGLVRDVEGRLKVRNRIYARVFDSAWVQASIPDAELRRLRAAAREEARKRREAEEGQRALGRLLYAAQMNLAHQAWKAGNVPGALELLEAQRPGPGEEELRAFEWRYLWRLCQDESLFTMPGQVVTLSPDGTILAVGSQPDDEPSSPGEVKLWDLTAQRELATLSGLEGGTRCLQFFPDGRTLAIAGAHPARVSLWDLDAGREIESFALEEGDVAPLTFSPDGRTIATRDHEVVSLWSVQERRAVTVLKGHTGFVHCATFSPNGRWLGTGSDDETAKLWDAATGQELATFPGGGTVGAVAFSPNGQVLATSGFDPPAKLWDIATQRRISVLKGHKSWVGSVAFSGDGSVLATASADKTVKLWESTHVVGGAGAGPRGRTDAGGAQRESRTLAGHTAQVHAVRFVPDGRTLVTASGDRTVKLWNVAERREFNLLSGHQGTVGGLAFSPDGRTLASCGHDGTVRLWDTATGQELLCLPRCHRAIWRMAFSPGGQTLAIGVGAWNEVDLPSEVQLWDHASGQVVATFPAHHGPMMDIQFSPDGRLLATGGYGDGAVKLWDVGLSQEVATFPRENAGAGWWTSSVALSADGKTLASGRDDGTVKLWDVASREELCTLDGHPGFVNCVQFFPKGNRLATASTDGTTKLWEPGLPRRPGSLLTGDRRRTGRRAPGVAWREVATLPGIGVEISRIAISPDGKTLAVGNQDATVTLWNLTVRQPTATLEGHDGSIWCVAFSPDGHTLATGSTDTTVRLWPAATFEEADG